MRKAGALAIVAVAAMALGGCATTTAGTPSPAAEAQGGAPAAPAGERFVDAQKRFAMVPPQGWAADTTSIPTFAVIFRSPTTMPSPNGPFTPNINVLVAATPAELNAVVDSARKDVSGLGGYKPTTDGPVKLSDGTPAQELGCTFTDAGSGRPLRNLQLVAVHGGTAVVITATALADGWDTYAATLDSALRTLTFTP